MAVSPAQTEMRVGFQDQRPRTLRVTDVAFAGAPGSVTVRLPAGGRTNSPIVGVVAVAAATAETMGAVAALAPGSAGGAVTGAVSGVVACEALQGTKAMISAPTEVRARRRALERWVGAPVACLPVMGLLIVLRRSRGRRTQCASKRGGSMAARAAASRSTLSHSGDVSRDRDHASAEATAPRTGPAIGPDLRFRTSARLSSRNGCVTHFTPWLTVRLRWRLLGLWSKIGHAVCMDDAKRRREG
ncbi:hypothetical protein CCE01nite_36300 [Cellulomonas cellasea]|uniref:Uncharacterized protein n=1 Tax=Cellulomonas cellasea TaxID=43670 RepID=A0A4Y3KYX2_9CELL|nr:hypothetical protein CCE01nite_36300 [Cellulomonas cellasea]